MALVSNVLGLHPSYADEHVVPVDIAVDRVSLGQIDVAVKGALRHCRVHRHQRCCSCIDGLRVSCLEGRSGRPFHVLIGVWPDGRRIQCQSSHFGRGTGEGLGSSVNQRLVIGFFVIGNGRLRSVVRGDCGID